MLNGWRFMHAKKLAELEDLVNALDVDNYYVEIISRNPFRHEGEWYLTVYIQRRVCYWRKFWNWLSRIGTGPK